MMAVEIRVQAVNKKTGTVYKDYIETYFESIQELEYDIMQDDYSIGVERYNWTFTLVASGTRKKQDASLLNFLDRVCKAHPDGSTNSREALAGILSRSKIAR